MSTFLELVQDLHRESGASGQAPTSVIDQRGEALRLVNWVKNADKYVQNLWDNWKFLRAQYSENTQAGTRDLPGVQDLAFYDEGTFKMIQSGDTDESLIFVVEYDAIKGEILSTDEDIPSRVIIMPDGTLEVDPPANGAHNITCDYYTVPVTLANNADVSAIPVKYQDVILGRALILYGNFEAAPEAKAQGTELYTDQLSKLENSQLPNKFNSRFRTGGFFEVIAS